MGNVGNKSWYYPSKICPIVIKGVCIAPKAYKAIKKFKKLKSISKATKKVKKKKGTPRNNRVQNKQVTSIVNRYGLSKPQRERLHKAISKKNYSSRDIEEIAQDIKNGDLY